MNEAQRELPRYQSHKKVWALKINLYASERPATTVKESQK